MTPRNNKPLKFKGNNSGPMIFPLHPNNMSKNKMFPKNRRKPLNLRPLLLLILLLGFISLIGYVGSRANAVAVYVDNEIIGYIKDTNTSEEELTKLVVAKLKQDVGSNIELNETISLKKSGGLFKKKEDAEQVISKVCQTVSYNQEATKILVDDKDFCIVSNIESAREALKIVLENYKCPEGTAQPEFAVRISTANTFVDKNSVNTPEEAAKLLSATHQVTKDYTVVSGDTFGSIASKFGMTESQLLSANPSITESTKTNIQAGQTLKVVSTETVLPIRTFGLETVTETIDYDTITRRNSNEPSSYRKEIREGVEGEKEVSRKIPYVNGVRMGEIQTSEKIIKEPVDRIIEVGSSRSSSRSSSRDSDDE